ncbi:MAG: choice-of-anchor J domain-containing protein, partial [Prevotellaceae bacterium]|nr:choice-of-anchor J domain-containing protein [Prevotellaceae bacterium]
MNKFRFILSMFCLLVFGLIANQVDAQQTKGGTPPTFLVKEAQALPAQAYVKMPVNFSVTELLKEDEFNADDGGIYRPRFAKDIPADITMENSGVWTELPDGRRVWRIAVEAKNAKAIIISYDEFYLPAGSQLFIYSADKTHVLGAYDNTSNSYGKQYSTPLVAGDIAVFEYVAPLEPTSDQPRLKISCVGYGYNNIKIVKTSDAEVPEAGGMHPTSPGSTYNCYVDIACSEGDGWRETGSAACYMYTHITDYGWLYCSSTLINNTANDRTPYIITAWHCAANGDYSALSSDAHLLEWQFYFFYENSTCGVSAGNDNYEMLTGATVVANPGGNTDGLLLRLVQAIPAEWITSGRIYFAGWDRRDIAPTSGVGINYPYAIPKKIATYTSPATVTGNVNYNYKDCGSSVCYTMANGMWLAPFVRTTNGWGRSESGASGGGLFNQNQLLVGTLCGAPSGQPSCSATSGVFNVRHAKLSYHWDKVGSTPTTQMKTWLDPVGNGTAETCPPYPNGDEPVVINPAFDFSADPTSLYALESTTFTYTSADADDYSIDSVKWEFESGMPAVSTAASPQVQYLTAAGSPFDVKLSVYATNIASGNDTVFEVTKTDYITVTIKGGLSAGVPVANVAAVDIDDGAIATPVVYDNGQRSINGGTPVATTVSNTGSPTYMKALVSGTGTFSDMATYSWTRTNRANSASNTAGNSGYDYGGTADNYSSGADRYFYAYYNYNYRAGHVRMYNYTALNLDTVAAAKLKFQFKNVPYSGYYDGLEVQYSNTSPTGTWTTILTIDESTSTSATSGTTGWKEFEVDLPNLTSTYYIGFKAMGMDNNGGGGGNGIGIDEIKIIGSTGSTVTEKSHVIIWAGDNVDFYDLSTGVPVFYEYEFEGGSPATSTSDAPVINVRYDTRGMYDVKQIVTNTFGSDTIVREDYVEVLRLIKSDFSADRTDLYALQSANFNYTISGADDCRVDSVKWEFEGGTPAESTDPEPEVAYNTETGSPFDVTLRIFVTDTVTSWDTVIVITKTDYINVTVKGGSNAAVPVANVAAAEFFPIATPIVYDNGQRRINGGAASNTTVSATGTPTYMKTLASGTYSNFATYSWVRTNRANSSSSNSTVGGNSGYDYGGTSSNYNSSQERYFYAFFDYSINAAHVRMYNYTPLILDTIAKATLKFQFKNRPWSGYWDGLEVQYSNTTPTGEWTTILTIDETTTSATTSGTTGWKEFQVELPNLSSTYYIGFTSMGKDAPLGGGGGYGMGIDNIEIIGVGGEEIPHVFLWEGDNVDFYDLSTGVPVLYEYEFEGGDPVTSTSDDPVINVRYDTEGLYDIRQWVKNSLGEDDSIREDYVTVYRRILETDKSAVVADCNDAIDEHITLTTNRNWTATFPSWMQVSPSSGTVATLGVPEDFDIHITVPAQTKLAGKNGAIVFISDDNIVRDTVTVQQASASPSGLTATLQGNADVLLNWDAPDCFIKEQVIPNECVVLGDIIDAGNGDFEENNLEEWKIFLNGDGTTGWAWRDNLLGGANHAHSGSGAMRAYSYPADISDNWL